MNIKKNKVKHNSCLLYISKSAKQEQTKYPSYYYTQKTNQTTHYATCPAEIHKTITCLKENTFLKVHSVQSIRSKK